MKEKMGKIIPLPAKGDNEEIKDKLPLAKCKELLGTSAAKYTDEQVLRIRDWFYKLAAITHEEYFMQQKQATIIIPITGQPKDNDNEERHYLRAG